MDFEKRKAATMAAMNSTETDKSPKGTIDTPIIPLLNTINNHPSYYTTSSCSGRISIFSHLPNKPKGGTWLFISHHPVNPTSILTLLFPESPHSDESTQPDSSELVFRFEPLIIAVECKDVGAAQFLVSLAISCGFRESGITSVSSKNRVIVAIRCSIRLEVPLGCRGRIMVGPEYLGYLVEIANQKMGANLKRTLGFLEGLRNNGFVGTDVVPEGGDGNGFSGGVDGDGPVFEEVGVSNLDSDSENGWDGARNRWVKREALSESSLKSIREDITLLASTMAEEQRKFREEIRTTVASIGKEDVAEREISNGLESLFPRENRENRLFHET